MSFESVQEIVKNLPTLQESREYRAKAITTLPWEGLALTRDEPAVPTHHAGWQKHSFCGICKWIFG